MRSALFAGAARTTGPAIPEIKAKIDAMLAGGKVLEKNLTTFDTLDYACSATRNGSGCMKPCAGYIVNWPDGHHTNGIAKHIEDLKASSCTPPIRGSSSIPSASATVRGMEPA